MYIRTKDGVYEIDKNTKGTEDFLWVKTNKANIVQCVWLNCIINEADTIEELCDEFVIVNKVGKFDKTYVIHYNMPNHIFTEPTIEEKIAYIKDVYKDELDNIKGAIYTSKGLIYVAKMNDKGELELI